MAWASNAPVSRIIPIQARVDKYMGGMAWNDEIGMFYPAEGDLPPFRLPHFASYRPTVRD